MTKYKLTYFDTRGRAEIIRLIFAAADQKYEDHRFPREQWPQIKQTMPWGQVPALDVDGKILAQSTSIVRYLAKQFGLAGQDKWEEALIDSFVMAVVDLINAMVKVRFAEESQKEAEMKKMVENIAPAAMANFEKFIQEHGNGYVVGSHLSVADLALFDILDAGMSHQAYTEADIQKLPKIKEIYDKVRQHPRVAAYVKNRVAEPKK